MTKDEVAACPMHPHILKALAADDDDDDAATEDEPVVKISKAKMNHKWKPHQDKILVELVLTHPSGRKRIDWTVIKETTLFQSLPESHQSGKEACMQVSHLRGHAKWDSLVEENLAEKRTEDEPVVKISKWKMNHKWKPHQDKILVELVLTHPSGRKRIDGLCTSVSLMGLWRDEFTNSCQRARNGECNKTAVRASSAHTLATRSNAWEESQQTQTVMRR
jgi:hypothetical protein